MQLSSPYGSTEKCYRFGISDVFSSQLDKMMVEYRWDSLIYIWKRATLYYSFYHRWQKIYTHRQSRVKRSLILYESVTVRDRIMIRTAIEDTVNALLYWVKSLWIGFCYRYFFMVEPFFENVPFSLSPGVFSSSFFVIIAIFRDNHVHEITWLPRILP